MQSRHWVTRVTSHATLGADPGDLTSAATQMSTLGTYLPHRQQTHPRRTQVKGDIKKLMMFKKPSILDECEYFPNITNVQLCFLNFLVMPRISTVHRFYEILLCIPSKWVWNIMVFVLNIHWFQTGTFEELMWVCEVSPGPGDGPARLMIGEGF